MSATGFSEREFYLREFRGRTILLAVADAPVREVRPVLDALAQGGARVVVLAPELAWLDALGAKPALDPADPRLEGEAWRALASSPRVGVLVPAGPFATAVRAVALRLGIFKLVWLDAGGGLHTKNGERQSFVHGDELFDLIADPAGQLRNAERVGLWQEFRAMLEQGVPNINVCSGEGLDAELFSYAGVGTLFTRERYIHVRRLTIDDFDAAADLIARGVEEGYLAPRSPAQVDQVLAGGFGAFVEERHLAGLGSLLPLGDRAGEVSALYTLTRFLGEGVGPYLVEFACGRARELGYDQVFACTTSDRVSAFFARNDFQPVRPDALPPQKWEGYDPERRSRVQCHRRRLD